MVIARQRSLLLRLPDYRQFELFPESGTEFFRVAFQGYQFGIAGRARFGLDEEGRVAYLELLIDPEPIRVARLGTQSIYADRLGTDSFVPQLATPEPTARATATPTAGEQPLAAPTAPVVETAAAPTGPEEGAGFPWVWLEVLLVVVAGAVGWVAVRRGSG